MHVLRLLGPEVRKLFRRSRLHVDAAALHLRMRRLSASFRVSCTFMSGLLGSTFFEAAAAPAAAPPTTATTAFTLRLALALTTLGLGRTLTLGIGLLLLMRLGIRLTHGLGLWRGLRLGSSRLLRSRTLLFAVAFLPALLRVFPVLPLWTAMLAVPVPVIPIAGTMALSAIAVAVPIPGSTIPVAIAPTDVLARTTVFAVPFRATRLFAAAEQGSP